MSMKRQKSEYRMGTGATSMLMIFIVLCLTTLSILSLATARSDLQMSKRSVDMTQAYYDAADRVQVILSELDAQLLPMQAEAMNTKREEVEERFRVAEYEDPVAMEKMIMDEAATEYVRLAQGVTVEDVELTFTEDYETNTIGFTVEAGHERFLEVEIVLLMPGESERYHVTKHVMTYIDDWEPEYEFELFVDPGYDEEAEDEESTGSAYDLEDIDNLEDDLTWID